MRTDKEKELNLLAEVICKIHGRQPRKGRKEQDSILLGLLLYTVKVALGNRGGFEQYVKDSLPFTERSARRLMAKGEKHLRQVWLKTDKAKAEAKKEAAEEAKYQAMVKQSFDKFAAEFPHLMPGGPAKARR